tara:strand:+ start:779 stop:961 length:183 start_codon:yes stop_codon:yes gene_type:complete
MGKTIRKISWLFEQKDGLWKLFRADDAPNPIKDLPNIQTAKTLAKLLNYKIVKTVHLKDQ